MERKSARKLLVLATMCLFLAGMTVSTVSAQWWTSSSSTSSSTTSSSTTSSTSSSSTSSTSSSSGSVVNDPSVAGPNSICTYTPPTNTGYSAAKVYYPCTMTSAVGATTLTGGYTNDYADMAWLANHVASHGYIVFAMTPNSSLGTNEQWTYAHRSGIAQLKKENTRSASSLRPNPIKGKVDTTKLQVMGFSKGGGGTLLAANALGSGIKTAQALAPYMDYAYSLSSVKAKTACYTGTSDTIANPTSVVTMYNTLPDSIDRTLGYFNGFPHTDWMPGSTATSNGKKAWKYIIAFMKYHMDSNSSYQTYLYGAEHTKDMNNNWFYGYAHNVDF